MNIIIIATVSLLQFHGISVHSDDYPYNENNWGVGVQFENSWAVDGFLDSYDNPAYMVGKVYDYDWQGLRLGATIGLVHHSAYSGPMVVPHVTYMENSWGVKAHWSPTKTGTVYSFSIVWEIGQ